MEQEREEDYELIHDPEERVDDPEEFRPELFMSRQERRWIILGALKSTLLIASAYLAGTALVIWLMLTLWL
ncbi:MAG: hypothetical protein Q4F29_06985 [Lachnospiraceae bacterium]|nr:hypothetical protein [Lachnospiraceae bacterium]